MKQNSKQIKQKLRSYVAVFFIFSVCFVYGAVLNMFYNESKVSLLKDAGIVFEGIIDIDRDSRFKATNAPFSFKVLPNDTSDKPAKIERDGYPTIYLEKKDSIRKLPNTVLQNSTIQTFLLHENPIKISRLDSLFQQKLQDVGIQARTAVHYIDNTTGKTHFSNLDMADLKHFFAYPKINTGIQDEITLQAFVKLSLYSIISKGFVPMSGITIVWLLVLALLSYIAFRKRKVIEVEKQVEVFVSDLSAKPRMMIRADIFLETDRNCLVYDDREIDLTNDYARFLTVLLSRPDYFATYDELIPELYGNIEEKMGKKRLEQLTRRLRNNVLVQIPDMELETVLGRGYRIRV